jgi:hypothetical protein
VPSHSGRHTLEVRAGRMWRGRQPSVLHTIHLRDLCRLIREGAFQFFYLGFQWCHVLLPLAFDAVPLRFFRFCPEFFGAKFDQLDR